MATTIRKHILVVGLGNHTHPGTRHNVGMMVVDAIAQRFNVPWSEKSSWKAEVATAHTSITTRHRVAPPPSTSGAKKSVRPTTADTISDTTTGGGVEASTSTLTPTPTTTTAPVVKKKESWVTSTLELTITLLKPLQLMNVSGTSVSKAAKDLGVSTSDILVIHDDMERDIGKLSFKSEGSANGHNGIKSCVKALGTAHFRRLRVGIGRPPVSDRSPKVVAGYVLGRFKPLEVEKLEELVYYKAGDEIIRVSTTEEKTKTKKA
ncbi:peptidyl-tRNA hydrolase protein 1 [Mortierella hygrophila]|uniref:Peptidyl-tRNA hydrolase n=1 Tax=Mortierella hygrophila TaxID=979708 RepID=A0A9P6K0V8_9FUNG|nr:peptidyl-tRNA hydrolase protein 1 [Mortierella hygrophila]